MGRTGSLAFTVGCSPPRNFGGRTFIDAGLAFFLPRPFGFSLMTMASPLLAAFLGFPPAPVLVKKAAICQYSFCFQSVKGWLWHWAHCNCTPRNIRATLSVIVSAVAFARK